MYLIKLSATSSTNDFLKNLSATTELKNYSVVWADVQFSGKGQMGSKWITEGAHNLTFSVYLENTVDSAEDLFTLNVIVANAVIRSLNQLNLTNIYVKWPNDILSYNKKIAGILIENSFQASGTIRSIIGIGINCEQMNFDFLPQASSIKKQYQVVPDRLQLLTLVVDYIKESMTAISDTSANEWQYYHDNLFRKDLVSTFENKNGALFNAIIKKINRQGQLVVQLENDDLKCFNLKDVKLMY